MKSRRRRAASKFLKMMRNPPPMVKVREIREEEVSVNPEVKEFRVIYGELAD